MLTSTVAAAKQPQDVCNEIAPFDPFAYPYVNTELPDYSKVSHDIPTIANLCALSDINDPYCRAALHQADYRFQPNIPVNYINPNATKVVREPLFNDTEDDGILTPELAQRIRSFAMQRYFTGTKQCNFNEVTNKLECEPSYSINKYYANDPSQLDRDDIIQTMLLKPLKFIDILQGLYDSCKSEGLLEKIKTTKLGQFFTMYYKFLDPEAAAAVAEQSVDPTEPSYVQY